MALTSRLLTLLFVVVTAEVVTAQAPAHDVLLVVTRTSRLPVSRAMLRAETSRIWADQGVRLSWTDRMPEGLAAAPRVFQVILTDDLPVLPHLADEALGAVSHVDGRMRPVVYASPAAVKRLIALAGVDARSVMFHRTLAVVLGRVIAHEVGHLVLDSEVHSATGLMRAQFLAHDIVFGGREALRLTHDQVRRVALNLGPAIGGPEPAARPVVAVARRQ